MLKLLQAALAAFFIAGCASVPQAPPLPEGFTTDHEFVGIKWDYKSIACDDREVVEALLRVRAQYGDSAYFTVGNQLVNEGLCVLEHSDQVSIRAVDPDPFLISGPNTCFTVIMNGDVMGGKYSFNCVQDQTPDAKANQELRDRGDLLEVRGCPLNR